MQTGDSKVTRNARDIRVVGAQLYFLPVQTRVPLKFGVETLTRITCARVCLEVETAGGRRATGWGETPLSVQWVWPSDLPYVPRERVLMDFCRALAGAWPRFDATGHPMEIGQAFIDTELRRLAVVSQGAHDATGPMPWLAALVCNAAFDLALHDAYGVVHGTPVYDTYGPEWMNRDLASYLQPAAGSGVSFRGRYPRDFLRARPLAVLPAWHLVGGSDRLEPEDADGSEPDDGYPVLLTDWIRRDGLKCLKIKLRGNDAAWDYARLARVGRIAAAAGVDWLSSDFNCTVTDPAYVTEILDRLMREHPRIFGMLLYVEQPFPYDLERHALDVHAVSARKPLFMDESAHDWTLIRLGRGLGWTGVALKTCKTQTGALLSLCWARAHGMTLMVQDLTNPMLAQVPHCLLAAYGDTIMGVETNAPQFYPEASSHEAQVHPGLYRRTRGTVDLSTLGGPGFGYRLDQIHRPLPPPAPPG